MKRLRSGSELFDVTCRDLNALTFETRTTRSSSVPEIITAGAFNLKAPERLSRAPTPKPLPLGYGRRYSPSALDAQGQVFIKAVGSELQMQRGFAPPLWIADHAPLRKSLPCQTVICRTAPDLNSARMTKKLWSVQPLDLSMVRGAR